MYCQKCGNKEEGKNIKFCSKCGERLIPDIKDAIKNDSAGSEQIKESSDTLYGANSEMAGRDTIDTGVGIDEFDVNGTALDNGKRASEIRTEKKILTPKSCILIVAFVLVFGLGVFIGIRLSTSETDSGTNKLVGTWVRKTDSGLGDSFTLEADGTVYDRDYWLEEHTETDGEIIKWSLSSEGELVIIDSWGDRYYYEYTLNGKTLILWERGWENYTYEFTKS